MSCRGKDFQNVSKAYKITKDIKFHEAGLLKLNCDKALYHLNWQAVLPIQETVRMTAEWYRSYFDDSTSIRDVTFSQIKEYEALAHNKGLRWAL